LPKYRPIQNTGEEFDAHRTESIKGNSHYLG
jgi:hypothetical protein